MADIVRFNEVNCTPRVDIIRLSAHACTRVTIDNIVRPSGTALTGRLVQCQIDVNICIIHNYKSMQSYSYNKKVSYPAIQRSTSAMHYVADWLHGYCEFRIIQGLPVRGRHSAKINFKRVLPYCHPEALSLKVWKIEDIVTKSTELPLKSLLV